MRKKTFGRSVPPVEKVKAPQWSSSMTVRGGEKGRRAARYRTPSPREKESWPRINDDSSSWDRQSGSTSVSWPEEMEEATTRRVLEQWEAIERTLHDEEDQVSSGPILEECIQWRTQLPHLRVTGRNPIAGIVKATDDSALDVRQKEIVRENRDNEEIFAQHSLPTKEADSFSKHQQREESQKEVIDLILGFVYAEILLDNEKEDSLNRDLDTVLRITPAPTYEDRHSSRKQTRNRKPDDRDALANKMEDVKDPFEAFKSVAPIDRGDRSLVRDGAILASARKQRVTMTDGLPVRKDRLYTPQLGRNKLGTVFNERIVVSPVPFVVSTRESFSTLKTTPIRFTGVLSSGALASQGSTGNVDLGLKAISAGRAIPTRISQVRSTWRAPVCPTIWPKNLRLAPIDVTRLPSGKNRTAEATPTTSRPSRNSLSPISRDAIPFSPQLSAMGNNNDDSLEIKGRRYVLGESSKSGLLKAGWNFSPRITKRVRRRGRGNNNNNGR